MAQLVRHGFGLGVEDRGRAKMVGLRVLLVALALLVLSPVAAAAQGYDAPGTIEVTPPNPGPGDKVTVKVTDCGPAGGTATVFVDDVKVGTETLDAKGGFTAEFVIPRTAKGDVVIKVDCGDVLSTVVGVDTDDAEVLGQVLARTGSNSIPLVQLGAGLIGIGAVALVLASTRRRSEQGQHGQQGRFAAT